MNPDLVKLLQSITGALILLLVLYLMVVKKMLVPGWIFTLFLKRHDAMERRLFAKIDPDYKDPVALLPPAATPPEKDPHDLIP